MPRLFDQFWLGRVDGPRLFQTGAVARVAEYVVQSSKTD